MLLHGYTPAQIVRVYGYQGVTKSAIYSRNSRVWKIPRKRGPQRGPKCPGCEKFAPVHRSYLCRTCYNASRPKSPYGIRSGEHHHWWKGGITSENQKIRTSTRYIEFRLKVFRRDNYTCRNCGKRGGKLHAHHLKSFADFPLHRFKVWNAVTMCEGCHRRTPNYGRRESI